jgi:hypothetical protein
MTVATRVATLAATGLLAACSTGTGDAAPDPATASAPSSPGPTPSVDSSSSGAVAIRGDWEAPEADWIVHFHEDGTFVEDYQGVVDFRVGKYEVEGDVVRLIGDDGNTDEGTVSGSGDDTRLTFTLGTLSRQ